MAVMVPLLVTVIVVVGRKAVLVILWKAGIVIITFVFLLNNELAQVQDKELCVGGPCYVIHHDGGVWWDDAGISHWFHADVEGLVGGINTIRVDGGDDSLEAIHLTHGDGSHGELGGIIKILAILCQVARAVGGVIIHDTQAPYTYQLVVLTGEY